MALSKGTATKKIRDAIDASTVDLADGVTAAQISDATSVGRTLLTAANVGAQRTALSVGEKVAAPASAGATGTTGQWATDTGFFYSCTATNTWKRVAIATW